MPSKVGDHRLRWWVVLYATIGAWLKQQLQLTYISVLIRSIRTKFQFHFTVKCCFATRTFRLLTYRYVKRHLPSKEGTKYNKQFLFNKLFWHSATGNFTIWRIFAPRYFAFCALHFALFRLHQLITFSLQYNAFCVTINCKNKIG